MVTAASVFIACVSSTKVTLSPIITHHALTAALAPTLSPHWVQYFAELHPKANIQDAEDVAKNAHYFVFKRWFQLREQVRSSCCCH